MVLIVVVVFDTTSPLPAMAPVYRGILLTLGGNTQQRDKDHGGGIPPTAHGSTADVVGSGGDDGGGSGLGRSGGGYPKWRTIRPSREDNGAAAAILNGEQHDRRGTTMAAAAAVAAVGKDDKDRCGRAVGKNVRGSGNLFFYGVVVKKIVFAFSQF